MKLISGWIGVSLVAISLAIQLFQLCKQQKKLKWTICAQIIILIATIFWVIYAFRQPEIYWPTGISNIIIAGFNLIFIILNYQKLPKNQH